MPERSALHFLLCEVAGLPSVAQLVGVAVGMRVELRHLDRSPIADIIIDNFHRLPDPYPDLLNAEHAGRPPVLPQLPAQVPLHPVARITEADETRLRTLLQLVGASVGLQAHQQGPPAAPLGVAANQAPPAGTPASVAAPVCPYRHRRAEDYNVSILKLS
ncbi:uncharacterized protein EHS24_009489 [Apiotrichum porosum]|uniref:Uncharacterized protein n=1 Tax=Apiotrichum porosum TaxID=105984 RepID=A0A427XLM4_9TREE|nr:uncharacterized protein EHS24_009489 [Apiotrichum porosum]RSH79829.1 hypothetical protein EHS24_009489 [Apiotrichum porosum]